MGKTDKKVKVTGVEVRTYKDYNFSGTPKTQQYKFRMMCALIKHNRHITNACKEEGTPDQSTHQGWLIKDINYKNACLVAKEIQKGWLEGKFMEKIEEGDVQCLIAGMKMNNVWSDSKAQVEVNVNLSHLGIN